MTQESHAPVSLWDVSASEPPITESAPAETQADVAIIGGGYTGLSTALHCAQAGLGAHVIETEEIGHGGSGRNVGLVNAAAWLPPAKVRKILGERYGTRFVDEFGQAPDYVFSLIEAHQIRCEATRAGTLHAAHARSGFRDLQARHAEWQRLKAPVDLLGADAAAEKIGSRAFHGALLDRRAGTVNPMGYCRGLARAALAAGARISTGTRALKLHRDGRNWRVETDQGSVRARFVILGTNAYTDSLWPGLEREYTTIQFFQMATEPLGARIDKILPGGQGLWDTGTIMFSLRRDQAGRLIIGSMGRLIGGEGHSLSRRWAQKKLARLFPDLGPVRFEEAWDGRIAMTPEHLPRIHKLDEGVFTPIGYNGRGITTGTVFGKAMAGLLTGADPESLPLPVTTPRPVVSAPVMSRVYQMAFSANQVLRSF